MLDEQRLRRHLPIGRIGEPLKLYDSIGSTNDAAARLARGGAPEGCMVIAREQTAGRGRAGRKWHTPAEGGLALSVVLRPALREVAGLGLIGALAAVESLEDLGLEALVKWPNDVLLGGRKVAGILAEASWIGEALDYVILGIGLNFTAKALEGGGEHARMSTSVESELGSSIDQTALLLELLRGLDHWYALFLSGRAHPDWEGRLAFLGREVITTTSKGQLTGRVVGLDEIGRLRLEPAAGEQILLDSDTSSIRPLESGLA